MFMSFANASMHNSTNVLHRNCCKIHEMLLTARCSPSGKRKIANESAHERHVALSGKSSESHTVVILAILRQRTNTRGFGVTKIGVHVAEQNHCPPGRRLPNSLTELTVELLMDLVVLNAKVRGVGIDDFNSDGVTFVTDLEAEAHDTRRDNCDRSKCSNQSLVDPHLESK